MESPVPTPPPLISPAAILLPDCEIIFLDGPRAVAPTVGGLEPRERVSDAQGRAAGPSPAGGEDRSP